MPPPRARRPDPRGAAPRPEAPPIVRRHRPTPPGGHSVYAVHPGALPSGVWSGVADALPADTGFAVLDLAGVPAYFEAALSGGHSDLTVASLVARLTEELRADRAAGPRAARTTFAGWSFGGVLAQSMTEELEPAERPDRLVLLDSIAPTDAYQQADDALDPPMLLRWFAMYLGAKRNRTVSLGPGGTAGLDIDTGLVRILDAAVDCGALAAGTPLPGLRKLYDTYVDGLLRNNRLTATHRPVPSSVPLALIKATHSLILGDDTLGWQELAPHGLDLRRPAPGDHYTMLIRPDAAAAIAEVVRPPR
ncbi:putative thioesterase [Actinacidiphila reveromycinica]|uniref:Putative thioesterase n=1 Tax=Actinacidiphila reveromycinica TaxID=659352 RepID=A0A7U3UWL1_9ACTN|nr:thioesterase domain-containing protein [Streptomyces sp. SN-593]BBB00133.1 putative thioesterase [Streptomyces sp. SN-593]